MAPLCTWRTVGGLALALAVLAAWPASAADRVVVTAGGAAIYEKPDVRSRVIVIVKAATVLDVVQGGREWIQVVVPAGLRPSPASAKSGYIEARLVSAVAGKPTPGRAPLPAPKRPARADPGAPRGWTRWDLRPFAQAGYEAFTASESFKAVFDSAMGPVYGGGIEAAIRRNLFVQADITHFRQMGERATVYQDEVYRLGIPDRVTITPILANVGYRFAGSRRFRPYVGGGAGVCFYTENAEFGEAGDKVSEQATAIQAFAGVEVALTRQVGLAIEGVYRSVPGILGTGGVSEAFGEKDLGGAIVRVRLAFGR